MKEETRFIGILADIGVEKETTIEILFELLDNSSKYVDNQEAIDNMLQEKLGLDLYISLIQYKNLKLWD